MIKIQKWDFESGKEIIVSQCKGCRERKVSNKCMMILQLNHIVCISHTFNHNIYKIFNLILCSCFVLGKGELPKVEYSHPHASGKATSTAKSQEEMGIC